MKWNIEEEKIVVNFYLIYLENWKVNIEALMKELKEAGFAYRDLNSTKMRISNISYLHTGKGLSKASKQTKEVYIKLKDKFL